MAEKTDNKKGEFCFNSLENSFIYIDLEFMEKFNISEL